MTMDGSMAASAAMARMVARSYPSAANRSRAARRIVARVASERRGRSSLMPTSVCQRLLTCARRGGYGQVNTCWQTIVGKEITMLPATTDVLVAGPAPVGLATATALTAAGVDVTVVDRTATAAHTSRAA